MHIIKENFNGNVNVGLYVYATDKYCLVGPEVPKEHHKDIKEALGVPLHVASIAGTSLLGVFLCGNSNSLLVPKIAFGHELEDLKKLGIDYSVIDTDLTALGNNILCNDKGCIVNPEFGSAAVSQIKDALKVPVKKAKIADLPTLGALAVHNKTGCLLHRDAEDFEIELIEKTLGVSATVGTVNFGSPYIRSGLVANSKGFIIGALSGGPEIQNADRTLGFIKV